jgi:hypothetical protein
MRRARFIVRPPAIASDFAIAALNPFIDLWAYDAA